MERAKQKRLLIAMLRIKEKKYTLLHPKTNLESPVVPVQNAHGGKVLVAYADDDQRHGQAAGPSNAPGIIRIVSVVRLNKMCKSQQQQQSEREREKERERERKRERERERERGR